MVPQGFSFAGVHSGIKQDAAVEDVSLIVSDSACSAVGVYTQNRVVAAPVILDQQRTPSSDVRAIVINSGNANACTGSRGMDDANEMSGLAALACGARPEQVLVLSTGIIGEHLPMIKIADGIAQAARQLGNDEASLIRAARGMMTTDTRHKLARRQLTVAGQPAQVTGLAKGAAMIGPNMATMLGIILTDVALSPDAAQTMLRTAVDKSFNCISVEGHMSTNDTVLLLANGQAGTPTPAERFAVSDAVTEVCIELAKDIPNDGEGATHLIEIQVSGCRNRDEARQIARTVADSVLVKTAVAGADPNWGRIVSAAGYSGVDFDPAQVELRLNNTLLYQDGSPVPFDAEQVSRSIQESRDTQIHLAFHRGSSTVRFWTCDLTAEYVRLNADYHT